MNFERSEILLQDALVKNPKSIEKAIDKLLSEGSLRDFVNVFWREVEPAAPLVPGWPLDAICTHLESVSRGEIKRLLINIPPGYMKSLLSNVFFPAWQWGPNNKPSTRFIAASYSQKLTIRDNIRFRQIITSDLYREFWSERFGPSKDQFTTIEIGNDKLGWKVASSVGGTITGIRGDIIILDDPNSVQESESENIRESTNDWFRETLPTRLNDAQKSAIVVVQQRTHESDISGTILDLGLEYEHLCYDDATEILTRAGWLKFSDLPPDVEVMGVDPKTLIGKWERPTHHVKLKHEGEVISYKSSGMDLVVTPDHRMIYKDFNDWKDNRETNWRVKAAKDLPNHFYLPQAVKWHGDSSPVNFGGFTWDPANFADFMGWYLSEGCADAKRCVARIVQKTDGRYSPEIDEVMKAVPFADRVTKPKHTAGMTSWNIYGKEIAAALAQFGGSHDKFVPREVKDMSCDNLKRFIVAFNKGDGGRAGRNGTGSMMSSRSKRLIDDIQECAVKAGWATTMHERIVPDRFFNDHILPGGKIWTLYVRYSKAARSDYKWYSLVTYGNIETIPYNGFVYCVSVPSTGLVVRRNGRVAVSGNCIPMEYDSTRHCVTVLKHDKFGDPEVIWEDPRGLDENGDKLTGADLDAADGELAWPERFPAKEVNDLKHALGPYAAAGQLNQTPAPRGGGIFKRDWWQAWPPADWPDEAREKYAKKFPDFSYVVASLDPALTEKQENDYSALTIWGIWRSPAGVAQATRLTTDEGGFMRITDAETPKIMLMYGWQRRLQLHGPPEVQPEHISDAVWNSPRYITDVRMKEWGLVEMVSHFCKIYRVDHLLIENKAGGQHVSSELQNMLGIWDFGVSLSDPGRQDKVARAHAVVHLFSNGVVYAPLERDWCDVVISEMSRFPRSKHDDISDSACQALIHLRDTRWALRKEESEADYEAELRMPTRRMPLYPV